MYVPRVVCYVWAMPATLLGLLFVPLAVATRGGIQLVAGVLEVHGGGVAWVLRHCTLLKGGAAAMTLGHVVLGCDQATLELTRSHERVHVRQYERWGPFFIPAYLLCAVWAMLNGHHPYTDNPFEREAAERD